MDCQTTSWFNCSSIKKLSTSLQNNCGLSVRLPVQMAIRWMSVKMFLIFFTCIPNSIYGLPRYQAASSNNKMDIKQDVHVIIILLVHQIYLKVSLSGCQSRCSSYCLLAHQIHFMVCLIIKLPLQMARWMSIKMFILLFTYTSNSFYGLSVKLSLQMPRWMSIKMFIIQIICWKQTFKILIYKILFVCWSSKFVK